MASKTAICNMALSHLAHGQEIANVDTERSKEAEACRRFYDVAVDFLLRSFPWNWAKKTVALALVEEEPDDHWDYSYRMPSDALAFRYLHNGVSRRETADLRTKFTIGADDTGGLIYTDYTNTDGVYGVYTYRVTDPEKFPPDFTMALSMYLAALIAPRVTGGDQFKLGQRAMQMYDYQITQAKIADANQGAPDLPLDSEFINVRE